MADYITTAQIDNIASETGKKLAAQKKIPIMIAMDGGDPTFRCKINGYSYEFPKGEVVEVPEDLATFIADRTKASVAAKKVRESLKNQQV